MICPPEHTHGTRLGCYSGHGCRCEPCRASWSEYQRETRRMQGVDVKIDVTRARDQLRALAVLGYSTAMIEPFVGLQAAQLTVYRNGTRARILASNAAKVARGYRLMIAALPPRTARSAKISLRARAAGWAGPFDDETGD